MLQGTGTDVGKSILLAGLCRAYKNRGLVARPFKPQNMSNNAAVASDGGEIGRAQALQARAAKIPSSIHMNPVLLKPQTNVGAQIVVQGKVIGSAKAKDYHALKPQLMPKVLDSFSKIYKKSDLTLVEGAGSPAEINLRDADIANMGFAEEADVPVILIADIDRGGVIAQISGTFSLLSKSEKARTLGYIINKFRGDINLFKEGIEIIYKHTGLNCYGIVPWFDDVKFLPKEDAMGINEPKVNLENAPIKIAVPRFPRIANYDDLDPLSAEPDVTVDIIPTGQAIPGDVDIIILPGSKTTIADLKSVKSEGWDIDIFAHVRRGGIVVGLCGGYQMLGTAITDQDGIEGPSETISALGLLNIQTNLTKRKKLASTGGYEIESGEVVNGYEMHIGITTGPDLKNPWLKLDDGKNEGAVSNNGQIFGCYLHGIFSQDGFRSSFLSRIRNGHFSKTAYETQIELTLNNFAEHLETHLDLDKLFKITSLDI